MNLTNIMLSKEARHKNPDCTVQNPDTITYTKQYNR